MFKLDLANIFAVNTHNAHLGLNKTDLDKSLLNFETVENKLLSRKQGFLDLPFNQAQITQIQEYVSSLPQKYESLVILGIGGSMLGPRTILDALYYPNSNQPQVYCLENIDPFILENLTQKIDLTKTLFLVQTKSGGTPETLAQYSYFRNLLEKANLDLTKHLVFVTDPVKGYLRQVATTEQIPTLDIPENVGGRFSVLSPIGLLITELVGLNATKMLEGARDTMQNYKLEAYKLAVIGFQSIQNGQNIQVIMPYSSRLKTLAEWCIQLYSESLGKKLDLNGKIVHTGYTPLVALGATDQHSQLQLFVEGPDDKLVTFIKVNDHQSQISIPPTNNSDLDYLSNVSFAKLLNTELEGVQESLLANNKLNLTLEIDKVDEYHLGLLFQFFELSTAYLGELLNINTFDQPGVELSKVITKEKLS